MANSREDILELEAKARTGDMDAKHTLGMAYRRGDGVPVDKSKGAELIIEAADGGCKPALSSVGVCYYYGDGVPKNHRLAMKWCLAAASAGLGVGFFNVADLFDDSDQIPKNPVEALAWFTCSLGVMPESADRMRAIVGGLSDENLDRAARRAVQIMKAAQADEPLDMVGNFVVVTPIAGSVRPSASTPASLLSYLLFFHLRSQTEFSDGILLREVLDGKSPMFIAFDEGAEDIVMRDLFGDKDRPARVAGVHQLDDGSLLIRVYDDFRHIEERVGKHFGREVDSKELQELVAKSNISHVVVNQGLPTVYAISKRGAPGGTKAEGKPNAAPQPKASDQVKPVQAPKLKTHWDDVDEKDPKGYYAYFGVDPKSDIAVIRKAYERILRECADNAFVVNEANFAFSVLSNPNKRRYYDTQQAALSRRMEDTKKQEEESREQRRQGVGLYGTRSNAHAGRTMGMPSEGPGELNRPRPSSGGCMIFLAPLMVGVLWLLY